MNSKNENNGLLLNMNSCNTQFDRIFNEIKEVGLRDSNQDVLEGGDNVFLFQPGFVSLLKSRFSQPQNNDNPPQNRKKTENNRQINNENTKIFHKSSIIDINDEEIPCKNLVSDTRRVFEYIAPKETKIDEIDSEKSINITNLPIKKKSPLNDDNIQKSQIFEVKHTFKAAKNHSPINFNHIPDNNNHVRKKSKSPLLNESKSFIFNASDYKTNKIAAVKETNKNQNFNNEKNEKTANGQYMSKSVTNVDIIDKKHDSDDSSNKIVNSDFVDFINVNGNGISSKSILKGPYNKKNVKTTRNIRFASNNVLITVHVYDREDSSSIEETVNNFTHDVPTKTEDRESDEYVSPPRPSSARPTDSKAPSIINGDILEDVMDFKSDMLF